MNEFERPRFFAGKLLTAEDLDREQRYHMEKRRLLNRMLQGTGVVSGLEVVPHDADAVTVGPGFALDALGREIVVGEPQEVVLPPGGGRISVCLVYSEVETERGTVRETFQLVATEAQTPEDAVVLAVVAYGVVEVASDA
jgi:hypothetical protein